mgnify:CR=1 FL=1
MRAVLAAARPGTRVVFASTATIAGMASHVDRTTPDAPITVYDRHKLAAEQLLARATERGDVRGVSLRLANVFGFGVASRNSARSVLNLMIRRAFTGEPLTVFVGDRAGCVDASAGDEAVKPRAPARPTRSRSAS